MWYRLPLRVALVAAISLFLVGTLVGGTCNKESGSAGDLTVTSSVDSGHAHDVTIKAADIESPPSSGKTTDTTYSGGHRHTITLTPADYQTIKDGSEVSVTSSSSGGHTHVFVLKK